MRLYAAILSLLLVSGCASNESSFAPQHELEIETAASPPKSLATEEVGLQSTKFGNVEWSSCTVDQSASWFLLLNPEGVTFPPLASCQISFVKRFGEFGFNVLVVNRPGVGRSEGKEKLGDDSSLKALKTAVEAYRANRGAKFEGVWAYGDASFLGFRLGKEFPFKVLMVGDAIFDTERVLKESTDQAWVSSIRSHELSEGPTFAEKRSIAWDFSGLPGIVFLYHSKTNARVPLQHAIDFKNSLATAGGYISELFVFEPTQPSQEIPQDALIKTMLSKYRSLKEAKQP